MGFFNFLKNRKKNKNEKETVDIQIKDSVPDRHNCCFDKIDWHFETASEYYCHLNNKEIESLTDEESDEIYLYAGNHIGFFITWIIKHHFEGEIFSEDKEGLEAVRNETMSGTEFLLDYCDGKFWGIDVSERIFSFVNDYYENHYLEEYTEWVTEVLHDVPMEFVGTWEDYHRFEHVIDKAYEEYNNRRKK